MQTDWLNNFLKLRQYLFGIIAVVIVSAMCYVLSAFMGYRVVALILLFTVSVTAMFFDILPVFVVAILSAFIWDFFFIPPKFTIYIHNTEDTLMFVMYFIIAMINAVLTFKNKQWQALARQKKEKSNTLKLYKTILNSLSHELRTPIATIIGACDNLKSYKTKLSEVDKEELLLEISKASLKLNGHVENLLNMSRIESGVIKPKRDWCDVNELLFTVKNKLLEYSSHHEIKIIVQDSLPLFYLDSGLIVQAIYNLVYNAIIYTPINSCVVMATSYVSNTLTIMVEDNGMGFPEQEIEHVFEKFFNPDARTTGGVGLGLSITKGFVEAHGGSVQLENRNGIGAKFKIVLPVQKSTTNSLKNE